MPLSKFPVTDWITAHYSYTTTYNWIGASLLAVSFGNTIENSKQNNVTGEFDFTRLYSKSKFLTAVSTPQMIMQLKLIMQQTEMIVCKNQNHEHRLLKIQQDIN